MLFSEPIETAVHELPRLSGQLGLRLLIKRDDLSPVPGGGNKLRKALRILRELDPETSNLVTTGDVNSNHCRVVALLAASRGIACDLVLHGDERAATRAPNYTLAALAGARIHFRSVADVAATIAHIDRTRSAEGHTVAVIPGGGHCRAGAAAFADAAKQVASQLTNAGTNLDYVVHASGTGATQAGLAVGFSRANIPVLGVSIARPTDRGMAAVLDAVRWLTDDPPPIHFLTDWIGQGYGPNLEAARDAIALAAESEGIILDPTYTGKAMAALIAMARDGRLPTGSTVLFWHTGGLLNLLSTNA